MRTARMYPTPIRSMAKSAIHDQAGGNTFGSNHRRGSAEIITNSAKRDIFFWVIIIIMLGLTGLRVCGLAAPPDGCLSSFVLEKMLAFVAGEICRSFR
jgi:hypothetical protein